MDGGKHLNRSSYAAAIILPPFVAGISIWEHLDLIVTIEHVDLVGATSRLCYKEGFAAARSPEKELKRTSHLSIAVRTLSACCTR